MEDLSRETIVKAVAYGIVTGLAIAVHNVIIVIYLETI